MEMNQENGHFKVSVVVPVFNEEGNIETLTDKLTGVLGKYTDYEVVYVDDGSKDQTLEIIKRIHEQNPRVHYMSLSRNFGHQNALKAGLDHASGDCVITMDGDLQHPPELIPDMIEKWIEGYDVVYTVRHDDPDLSFFKRKTSALFYKLMHFLSDYPIPKGAADFRLLDASVVEVMKDMKEYYLFLRGITAWVGFKQYALEYIPHSRFKGETKYSFKRMMGFAADGITSFSLKPLRLSIIIGTLLAFFAFGYGLYAIGMKLFSNHTIQGWASVLVSVLFIGGIQLVALGIIGEYIGKLFMEMKQRPRYIIKENSKRRKKRESADYTDSHGL